MTDLAAAPLALRAFAAAVYLAISVLAARRAADVPLARPLGIFTLGLFTYSLLDLLSPGDQHRWLNATENAVASMLFIPAVELLLGFAGRRRDLRWVRAASAVVFVALALSCFASVFFPGQEVWAMGQWELAMAGGIALFFGLCAVVLVKHFRRSGAVERTRSLLLLGALLLGGTAAASTLLGATIGTPNIIDLGMMATGVLLALLFFRTKLLAGTTNLAYVTALVFAALVVVGELLLFPLAGQATAVFVGGSVVLVLFAFAALRPVFHMAAQERVRKEHLTNLGRLSEQMVHDLRNPLSAVLGAGQILQEELRRGSPFEEQGKYLDLIVDQAKRLERVIATNRRMAEVEPVRRTIDLDGLLTRVVRGQQQVALDGGVTLELVPTDLGTVQLDADLICTALENFIRNAIDAMTVEGTVPAAGTIQVSGERQGERICLTVADQGPGMNARVLEQARQLYFTTKANGTGLGLAFAGRVAEAHGGQLRIDSVEGEGTTVTLAIDP